MSYSLIFTTSAIEGERLTIVANKIEVYRLPHKKPGGRGQIINSNNF
jgi:hypothetical protein